MLLQLCRADLRVPVDPMFMASAASLTGGAICRCTGLTIRGVGASKVAQTQRTVAANVMQFRGEERSHSLFVLSCHSLSVSINTPGGSLLFNPLQPTPCGPLTSFEPCDMQKRLGCGDSMRHDWLDSCNSKCAVVCRLAPSGRALSSEVVLSYREARLA